MTPTTGTTVSSITPVTRAESVSIGCLGKRSYSVFNDQTQFLTVGFPAELIQDVFMLCLSKGDIKDFIALGLTNVCSYAVMQELVNETDLTQLCPNLRILDAKTFTFHADLRGIDRHKALRSYYKLEPFVERREGLTIIFNQGGLTLKDMKENTCGVSVDVLWDSNSEKLDNIAEEDIGPEMVSNAPVIETRDMKPEVQEVRVRDEVGFDGKPTLIQSLALLIATQKELKICLYGETPTTYGRTSTEVGSTPMLVGGSAPGRLCVTQGNWPRIYCGAGGRLKL